MNDFGAAAFDLSNENITVPGVLFNGAFIYVVVVEALCSLTAGVRAMEGLEEVEVPAEGTAFCDREEFAA